MYLGLVLSLVLIGGAFAPLAFAENTYERSWPSKIQIEKVYVDINNKLKQIPIGNLKMTAKIYDGKYDQFQFTGTGKYISGMSDFVIIKTKGHNTDFVKVKIQPILNKIFVIDPTPVKLFYHWDAKTKQTFYQSVPVRGWVLPGIQYYYDYDTNMSFQDPLLVKAIQKNLRIWQSSW